MTDIAMGSYQDAILDGTARISGADLKGKARKYGAHYKRSREAVVQRLMRAGIPTCVTRGPRGLLTLEWGDEAAELLRYHRPTPLAPEWYLGAPLVELPKGGAA
jgi:hypothetical protein